MERGVKDRYIDIMCSAMAAYTRENILAYYRKIQTDEIREHGFQRVVSNYGILIAKGKGERIRDLFPEMFTYCLREIKHSKGANDFAIKEMAFAVCELEQAGLYSELIPLWKRCLEDMNPLEDYKSVISYPEQKSGNWTAYNVAGECVKKAMGLAVDDRYIDIHMASQIRNFDEEGFYHDPGLPMLYDLAARAQMAVALKNGYNGRWRQTLEKLLRRAAVNTLKMQSVTGEIPFGGRSNQFLFNEAYLAALMEFEAARTAKDNPQEGAVYKRAAHLAADSILRWLEHTNGEKHIKNHYPPQSAYGCEKYAFFNKYMASLASFIYLAYYFADDSAGEAPCPAQRGGFTFSPPAAFHKFFANAGGYFLEFDTNADPLYDATGLGRVQKSGAPSELMMSVPCPAVPHYAVDIDPPVPLSMIGDGESNGESLTAQNRLSYAVESIFESPDSLALAAKSRFARGIVLTEQYTVCKDGVIIRVSGAEKVGYTLPVFAFDGREQCRIESGERFVRVEYRGWICVCETDGRIVDEQTICANRNGHYRKFRAFGDREITITITIEKQGGQGDLP